ncbi:MAG TPA: glycosyltransferase family 9 protein [Flavobacteriaceae bacterium]|nr:glycosyltransferase family 9 protein [Flavobacteriaceae bacterium]
MSNQWKINKYRRRVMQKLTENVGAKHRLTKMQIKEKAEIKNILLIRPNHRLGNLLMLTPLLQEIETVFPAAKVNVFIKGTIGPVLFKEYTSVDKIVQLPRKPFKQLGLYIKQLFFLKKEKYDLVINADKNSSSGKIFTQLTRATYKIFGTIEDEKLSLDSAFVHMATSPVFCLRQLLKQSGIETSATFPALNLKLTPDEIELGKKQWESVADTSKLTLCIFTFATGTKCYSKSWWDVFYRRLLQEFPAYQIVEVLPVENVSQIEFKAPSFYSKDVREIAAFFYHTEIFIGADSGMMHLAAASGIPTVGLFSKTNSAKYKPYGNRSMAIDTNTTSQDDWITNIKRILES